MKDILFIGASTGLKMDEDFSEVFFKNNSNEYNCINLSLGGAGNFYMAGCFFEYINKKQKPDYVFFKFTGLGRIDLPFDNQIKIPNYPCQSSSDEQKSSSFLQIEKNWVCSGGYTGSWLTQPVLRRIFGYMYNTKDQNSTNEQSLFQIFACISLCETLKIPYNWTFDSDPTNPPSKEMKVEGYIDHLPNFIPTKNMLNFSPLNFSYSINEIPSDGRHYSRSTFIKYLNHEKIFNKINDIFKTI